MAESEGFRKIQELTEKCTKAIEISGISPTISLQQLQSNIKVATAYKHD
jgi:hypothetical protein